MERLEGQSERENSKRLDNDKSTETTETSLFKYIANLSKEDAEKLLAIAKNETTVEEKSKSMTEYMDLLHAVFSSTNFNTTGNAPQTRNQRYEIYEEMDESTAYISSALDILSDDATQADEKGEVIHINSGSEKVNNLIRELIEEFELETKVSKWARAIAKYGDLFIKVDGSSQRGILEINDTVYPGVIDRRDLNGKLVAFSTNQHTTYSPDAMYPPWAFVHFRHKGDIYKEESSHARLGLSNEDDFGTNLTSAYGQSILRPAIKVYAQLRFVENMILLSRLTNSIRRNIFLINVGDVTPDKAYETISNYARLLKKDVNFNIEDGIYSASKHTISYDEDIFLPIGDPQNDVRIEQVGGDANVKEAYDLEYLLNKLFSALKVPKAYLNYEQDLNARSTLIQLDIRYARSVSQLQRTVETGLRRLFNIHLTYHGLNPEEVDLEVFLTPVSAIDEEARITQQQTQIAAARDMWDLLVQMKDGLAQDEVRPQHMDLPSVAEYLMRDYLELDRGVIDVVFGREKSEETYGKVHSSRSYGGGYPTPDGREEYQKLLESLESLNPTKDEEITQ